jgi:hypothetical protein
MLKSSLFISINLLLVAVLVCGSTIHSSFDVVTQPSSLEVENSDGEIEDAKVSFDFVNESFVLQLQVNFELHTPKRIIKPIRLFNYLGRGRSPPSV